MFLFYIQKSQNANGKKKYSVNITVKILITLVRSSCVTNKEGNKVRCVCVCVCICVCVFTRM